MTSGIVLAVIVIVIVALFVGYTVAHRKNIPK